MLELMASRVIRQGAEVLELYRVTRRDGATDCFRLVWAEARFEAGRKPAMLDVRDFPGTAANGARALAAFMKAR